MSHEAGWSVCPACNGAIGDEDFGSQIHTAQFRPNYVIGHCPDCGSVLRAEERGSGWRIDNCRIVED